MLLVVVFTTVTVLSNSSVGILGPITSFMLKPESSQPTTKQIFLANLILFTVWVSRKAINKCGMLSHTCPLLFLISKTHFNQVFCIHIHLRRVLYSAGIQRLPLHHCFLCLLWNPPHTTELNHVNKFWSTTNKPKWRGRMWRYHHRRTICQSCGTAPQSWA